MLDGIGAEVTLSASGSGASVVPRNAVIKALGVLDPEVPVFSILCLRNEVPIPSPSILRHGSSFHYREG